MLKAFFILSFNVLLFDMMPALHHINTNFPISFDVKSINDPVLVTDSSSCTLPFTRAGKLIIVKGRIDSVEGNFILDTGAPCLVLNSTYFRDLEMTHSQDEVRRDINGEGSFSQKTTVKELRIGSFTYSRIETDLLNLGHIENIRGIKILGLLGVSLFKQCELIVDYEKQLVHLYHIMPRERKTYKHKMLGNQDTYVELPFLLRDNRIILQTKMAKKNVQFVVDYAAETNLIDSRLPAAILDSVQIKGRTILVGSGSKKLEVITGMMSGLKLDRHSVPELPVIITSLENTCFANDICINGVLGYDFLSRHILIFNFVTRKLYVLR